MDIKERRPFGVYPQPWTHNDTTEILDRLVRFGPDSIIINSLDEVYQLAAGLMKWHRVRVLPNYRNKDPFILRDFTSLRGYLKTIAQKQLRTNLKDIILDRVIRSEQHVPLSSHN